MINVSCNTTYLVPIHDCSRRRWALVSVSNSEMKQFFARSRKSRDCAEAYRGTSHKRSRRLTPRLRKRAIYGWKLPKGNTKQPRLSQATNQCPNLEIRCHLRACQHAKQMVHPSSHGFWFSGGATETGNCNKGLEKRKESVMICPLLPPMMPLF